MSANHHQLGHPALASSAATRSVPFGGFPLGQAPFSNGLIWMLDLSIGLGTGKLLAVLAVAAHHQQLAPDALSLPRARCLGVCVADSWTGTAIAAVLKRLIAQLGRPAAYLKDGGRELHKAVDLLAKRGLASPCLDNLSHAAAGMLKRSYQPHPACARVVSACGRVSGQLTQTLLACLAPPAVRTKARFLNVPRLFTWAERLLKLSPAGGAKAGSILARLRACLARAARVQRPPQALPGRDARPPGVPEDSQNPGALP